MIFVSTATYIWQRILLISINSTNGICLGILNFLMITTLYVSRTCFIRWKAIFPTINIRNYVLSWVGLLAFVIVYTTKTYYILNFNRCHISLNMIENFRLIYTHIYVYICIYMQRYIVSLRIGFTVWFGLTLNVCIGPMHNHSYERSLSCLCK